MSYKVSRYLLFIAILVAACTSMQAPITGRTQLMSVSEQQSIADGLAAYQAEVGAYAAQGALNNNKLIMDQVRRVFPAIIRQAIRVRPETEYWNWTVDVVDSNDVNAHCYAGGKIVLFTGLVTRLGLNDGELAAVLAHETSHALAQHQREQESHKMVGNILLGVLDVAILAASNGGQRYDPELVTDIANTVGATVENYAYLLPFSREQEYEADHIGLVLLANAGFNPNNMVTAFKKLVNTSGSSSFAFLSTHPGTEDRIDQVMREMVNIPQISTQVASQDQQHTSSTSYVTTQSVTPTALLAEASHQLSPAEEISQLETQVRKGRSEAAMTLANIYYMGRGVTVDKTTAIDWAKKSAHMGNAVAMNALGNVYYKGDGVPADSNEAFKWYIKGANAGSADSQINAGYCYFAGVGIAQDYRKAERLFTLAADDRPGLAYLYLGKIEADGVLHPANITKALQYWKASASQKQPIALFNIGYVLTRNTPPHDVSSGIDYLKQSAAAGYGRANALLFEIYMKGQGVQKDEKKAMDYLRSGVMQNDAQSVFDMANALVDGLGIEKNLPEAINFFERAIKLGSPMAPRYLANLYSNGIIGSADYTKARAYYEIGSSRNDYVSSYILGNLYLKGVGVQQDANISNLYFTKALNGLQSWMAHGDEGAVCYLGEIYLNGRSVQKSIEKGMSYLKQGASNNVGLCEYFIGVENELGRSIEKNEAEALRWFKQAAAHGSPEARRKIGALGGSI